MILNSTISLIVAMDEKRGIGRGNDLLFKIPEDMKRMKALTTGHPLVMGRKTFESLGRLLPNRTHIVITRNPKSLNNLSYKPNSTVSSLEEGIETAKTSPGGEEVFIFGGGQVYNEALKKGLVDKIYLTLVHGDFGADVFLPELIGFREVKKEKLETKEYILEFLELTRAV